MSSSSRSSTLSHTRAVPLPNLTGLCVILGERPGTLSIKQLAQEAVDRGVIGSTRPTPGERLPTRINHHMIALRELGLVSWTHRGGHVYYTLKPAGQNICVVAQQTYDGEGAVALNSALRAAWRPVLADSPYVREHWLKYFMPGEKFSYDDLIAKGSFVTIYRLRGEERHDAEDSGYRMVSQHERWEEQEWDDVQRREVYEGLRRWTNECYLTDDRVLEDEDRPFKHVSKVRAHNEFEIESHIARRWLDPERDLDRFESELRRALEEKQQGNRITIPDLLLTLCWEHGYAKDNLKEMLQALYYERGRDYFFERGSEFLIRHAFAVPNPQDFYVQIEGAWRTSLICY